jgi:hypothetical protein
VFNNLLKVSKTLISKCVKPAIELAKKTFQPQINNIKNSSLGKVAAKLLPVVNSPAVKSTVSRIQKALAVPKTVTPVKKEDATTAQTSNKTQVNQPKVVNTSSNTQEEIVKLIEEYTKTDINQSGDIIRGDLMSDAINFGIDMSMNSPTMPGSLKLLRELLPEKFRKNDKSILGYEILKILAKDKFNQMGNDVYNAQIPIVSNLIGSFVNSSDYKENGPLPLESVKTNHYLAIINQSMYMNSMGGFLNHADSLTTINNMMNNTNMSSVIGANAGGALIDGGVGMADSLIEMVLNPNEFIKNLYTLVKDSPVIIPALKQKMYEYSDHFVYEAKPQEKARLEGRIAFELYSFVALSALGKAGEGAKTAQEIEKMKALTQTGKEFSTITKSGGVVFRTAEEEAVVAGKSAVTVVEEGGVKGSGNAGKVGEAIDGAGEAIKKGSKSSVISVTEATPPGSSHPVKVYTDGNAQINTGKIETYIRGNIKEPSNYGALKQRIKDLKKIQNNNPSEFTKPMKKELIAGEKTVHNYERSKGMGELLNDAGIVDTPKNNEMIAKSILNAAKEVTPENTKIVSYIKGTNKTVLVESWWIIDSDGIPYCSTIILKAVK